VEYRYAGSDPNRIFPIGDPGADPSVGWVRLEKSPTRFSLVLRDIPPGDPGGTGNQTLYVRIVDEAGSSADFSYTWKVKEVVGDVLLVDDCALAPSRDAFYRDAMDRWLPGAYSIWDVAAGLPARDEDVRLTLQQFKTLVWYTSNGESANLVRAQALLIDYVNGDIDPDTPGDQHGKLYLEAPVVVGNSSHLTSTFRTQVLGIAGQPDPRNPLATYSGATQTALGPLDIYSQDPGLPDLSSVGENYQGSSGRYFGLNGLSPLSGASALYKFEQYQWGGPSDPTCRTGCTPVVAVRKPDTGEASTVLLGFQLEFANAMDNAIDAFGVLLTDLGVALTGGTP